MAIEQFFQEAVARNDSNKEDESSVEKWKSVSAAVTSSDNNPSGGFDCNICLDFVQDPVVTLCGHLYCWPCIYKWLHFQSISTENPDQNQQQQCPVCKAEVSRTTLVPLYGRGQTTKPSGGKAPHLGLVIPRRPLGPACGALDTLLTSPTISPRPSHQLHHHHQHHRNYLHQSEPYYPHTGGYTASPMLSPGGTTTTNVFHPIIGMFSEMVYARVSGNSVTTNLYNHPNSYHLAGSSSPRVRRHVVQADKSLSRICFFLFCCIFLCLLLF